MAGANVNIAYDSFFGSNGSGDDNFSLPVGICTDGTYLYIVDKQNHRIKIHDLSGVYVSQFGSVGSGNDEFFFPEDICTDGTHLYITDGANHRIKKHDLSGVFVSEFGVRGTGNNEFEYPCGIDTDGVNLYIADKGNSRIMVATFLGVYVAKYGFLGTGAANFNFPEGITIFDSNSKIAICDSGNKRIVVRRASDGLYLFEFGSFVYPSKVSDTNGVLTVTDRQDNKLYVYDYEGNLAETYNASSFLFPESVVYNNDKLYVVDSANYRVQILDFNVAFASDFYLSKITALTKQLYPTGRAWWMRKGGIFDLFHEALAFSEARAYASCIGQLDVILPDNDNFTTVDADKWESALGLYQNSLLGLDERKLAIRRKINHPGTTLGRQSSVYIESELQAAGFDVYVHENRFGASAPFTTVNPISAIHDLFKHDEAPHDGVGFPSTLIANYIDESKDSLFSVLDGDPLKQTFFIGGSVFGAAANVDAIRKQEFRELILKLKPCQMVGFLQINYI